MLLITFYSYKIQTLRDNPKDTQTRVFFSFFHKKKIIFTSNLAQNMDDSAIKPKKLALQFANMIYYV